MVDGRCLGGTWWEVVVGGKWVVPAIDGLCWWSAVCVGLSEGCAKRRPMFRYAPTPRPFHLHVACSIQFCIPAEVSVAEDVHAWTE